MQEIEERQVMTQEEILNGIRNIVRTHAPEAKVILFGSRARGDAHKDSDWDLLLLVDQEKISSDDFDRMAYPLYEYGWEINQRIEPLLYTYNEWIKRSFTPFYKNIEEEGIEL